ncbi:universal stress protein [bacterium]|nr:universal stress protein [bacterium]
MKIIIAVDDSPSSSELVRTITSRKWPQDVNFKILTVLEPSCVSYADLSISEYAHTAAELYTKRKAAARHHCEAIRHKLEEAIATASIHYEVREGAPWAEIVTAAVEWSADKIMIGVHSKDVCPHNMLGSVSRAVVNHSPCSVEVVSTAHHRRKHAVAGAVAEKTK